MVDPLLLVWAFNDFRFAIPPRLRLIVAGHYFVQRVLFFDDPHARGIAQSHVAKRQRLKCKLGEPLIFCVQTNT